jgi:hypothetical protein
MRGTGSGPLLRRGNLDWNAYENGERMAAVFMGRFRDGDRGQILGFFRGFLGEFSDTCVSFLPRDAVRVVSRLDNVTRDGLGREIRRDEGIPNEISMAPRFVDAYKSADPQSTALAGLFDIVGKGGNPLDFITTATTWIDDTRRFFEVEPCQGQATLQMGENLLRLVEGRRPLQEETNPRDLLARLEVPVDPTMERRDREAKEARMQDYWHAQKREWLTPPELEHRRGGPVKPYAYAATYAAIPPGYEIPVVRPRLMSVEISVSRPSPGGLRRVHLTTQQTGHPFARAPKNIQQIYARDFSAVVAEQGWILSCFYDIPGRSAYDTRDYWFEKVPAAADPAKLRASSPDHPMLTIRGARSTCPADLPPG